MKKGFRFLFIILALLSAVFLIVGVLISIYAPRFIEDQASRSLKMKVSLGRITLGPSLTVTLDKIEIGTLANIRRISVSPDISALFSGKAVIRRLSVMDAIINLERGADGNFNLPQGGGEGGKPPEFYPLSLQVRNAKIIYTDRKVSANGYQLIVDKLNINVAKVSLPLTSLATNFRLDCQLANSSGKAFGEVSFSGWLDYLSGDMDAKFEAKDVDVANFSPYCGSFISREKLLSARLDLVSLFKSKDNALNINTDFNLSGLVYEKEDFHPAMDLAKNTLDLFTGPDGNLHLVFDIATRLDKPDLNREKLEAAVLKAAMKNLGEQTPEQIAEKVNNMIGKFKEYGKGLKEIFGK